MWLSRWQCIIQTACRYTRGESGPSQRDPRTCDNSVTDVSYAVVKVTIRVANKEKGTRSIRPWETNVHTHGAPYTVSEKYSASRNPQQESWRWERELGVGISNSSAVSQVQLTRPHCISHLVYRRRECLDTHNATLSASNPFFQSGHFPLPDPQTTTGMTDASEFHP